MPGKGRKGRSRGVDEVEDGWRSGGLLSSFKSFPDRKNPPPINAAVFIHPCFALIHSSIPSTPTRVRHFWIYLLNLSSCQEHFEFVVQLLNPVSYRSPASCPAQDIGKDSYLSLNISHRTHSDGHREQDKEATVYIGNLDERVSDSLVWELMLQAGRIVNVHLPKDRVTQSHQGYGFVEFISEEDAEYASRIMNGIRIYGKPIRVNKASADKQKTVEIGAELFIGNLDPMVTEQVLYDTFGRFGNLTSLPKVFPPPSPSSHECVVGC